MGYFIKKVILTEKYIIVSCETYKLMLCHKLS